jgi:hypothetical protein
MKDAVISTVKEALRIALFAGIAALVAWGSDKLAGLDPSSTTVIIGTIVIRLADKFVHENEDINAKGIAPF